MCFRGLCNSVYASRSLNVLEVLKLSPLDTQLVRLNDVSSSVWPLIDLLFENILINEGHREDSLSSWKLNWAGVELLKANWRLFLCFLEFWRILEFLSVGKVRWSLAEVGLLFLSRKLYRH